MADVKYLIEVDSAGAVTALKQWDQAVQDAGKHSQGSADQHGAFGGQIDSVSKKIIAAIGSYALWKGVIVDATKAALDEESAERELSSALETTGRTVSFMLPSLMGFSKELSQNTLFSHDQTEASAALLAQMTNLDLNGIQRAMKGAAGLATVMKVDLQSATMLVMKAMDGNTAALSRYGIRVDDSLPPQERQNALLEQVEKLFARATDAADSHAGKLKTVEKNIDLAKEALGRIIIEGTGFISFLDKGARFLEDFANSADMVRNKTKTAADANKEMGEKLYAAAAAAGLSLPQFIALADKYKQLDDKTQDLITNGSKYGASMVDVSKSIDKTNYSYEINFTAMANAIAKGKEGAELQKALIEIGKAHAEQLKKEAQAIDETGTVQINAINKDINKIRDLADEMAKAAKKGELSLKGTHDYAIWAADDEYHKRLDDINDLQASEKEKGNLRLLAQQELHGKYIGIIVEETQQSIKAINDVHNARVREDLDFGKSLLDRVHQEQTVVKQTTALNLFGIQQTIQQIHDERDAKIQELQEIEQTTHISQATLIADWKAYYKAIESKAWKDEVLKDIEAAASGFNQLFSNLSQLSTNSTQSRLNDLDAWDKAQQDSINNSKLSEEDKQKKLAELDKDYNTRKKGLQREQAISQQNYAIVEAMINTAVAETKALSGFIPPFNIIMAAISAAAGAVQIAAIRAQPMPMAKGGILTGPTYIDDSHVGGEVPGSKEAVIPLDSPEGKRLLGNGRSILLTLPIYIGGKKIQEQVIEIVEDASAANRLRIKKWSVN